MPKTDNKVKQEQEAREERLKKIRTLIAGNGEDAAKLLKMWMDKEASAKAKR